jgi:hypothetical protein
MRALHRRAGFLGVFLSAGFGLAAAFAQPAAQPSIVSVTITVTALGAGYLPAIITQSHLRFSSTRDRLDLTGWARPQGADDTLQLAILIDNNIKASLQGQPMQDLANFIKSQPPTASIGIYFAEKGQATQATDFSTDHQAVANALTGITTSGSESLRVYPSLSQLAAHWPSPPAAHRQILMIGSGYDALIGGMLDPNVNAGNSTYTGNNYDSNISGERDPYLNSMIESVETAGIEVHSIYVPDPRFAQMLQANIMRDKLIEVSTEAGGLAFYNGDSADSFAGYLRELTNALHSQYLLTFTTEPSHKKKGELRDIAVATDLPGVTLYAPRQVFVPGS